jgi:acyl-CoA thioester hydrolase
LRLGSSAAAYGLWNLEPLNSMAFPMINPAHPQELAAHPISISLPVQWGDQDAFGHVNNVVYFRWMESARIEYFRLGELAAASNQGAGPILASIKCDFRRQLVHPDTVLVSASIASIGRTSMKMVHLIYSTAQQAVAAEGESVIVMFDYQAQRPILVADNIRVKIGTIEGRGGQSTK